MIGLRNWLKKNIPESEFQTISLIVLNIDDSFIFQQQKNVKGVYLFLLLRTLHLRKEDNFSVLRLLV